MTRIEFAVTELNEAESFVEKVGAKRNQLESKLIRDWSEFDPLNDDSLANRSQIRIAVQDLDTWLANPPVLRRAVDALARELGGAKPVIQMLAQSRSVAEQTISCCYWHQRLPGIEMRPPSNQIRIVLGIAKEILSDINVLLSARRGIQLTPDEVRSGLVQLGNGRGHRALTLLERNARVADE
jgi:hypothetical protein